MDTQMRIEAAFRTLAAVLADGQHHEFAHAMNACRNLIELGKEKECAWEAMRKSSNALIDARDESRRSWLGGE